MSSSPSSIHRKFQHFFIYISLDYNMGTMGTVISGDSTFERVNISRTYALCALPAEFAAGRIIEAKTGINSES